MADFFVSRNKADKAWAVWIAWQLEAAGYSVIVQDWDFRPGSNFALKMHEAIANSKRTIAVLSPDFLKSEYTAPEWAAAFAADPTGAEQKLVPVRVRPCEPKGLLQATVYIDLVNQDAAGAQRELLDGLKRRRAKPSTAPPYPGQGSRRQPKFPGSTPDPTSPRRTAAAKGTTATRRVGEGTGQSLTPAEAKARIDEHAWGVRRDRGFGWTGDAWLGAVVVPERQDTPYIDVLDLGNGKLRDAIGALALVGNSAIFRRDKPTTEAEKLDHLFFEQTGHRMRGVEASLQVHTDGTLVYRAAIGRRGSAADHSLAASHLIDEHAVRRAIAAFVAFAASFYKLRRRDPGSVYLGVSLSDIGQKHFGRLPSYPMDRFTIGSPRVDDPLRVPDDPLKISKAQLAKPSAVAQTAVAYIARAFRLENAYFTP